MYSIVVDRERRIVCATMSGFFSQEEVAAFARDELAAAASLGCGTGRFGLLVEASGGLTQSQEVVAAFRQVIAELPLKAGRIAVVSGGALLKMQLRRMTESDRMAVFDAKDEALRWIEQGLAEAA